MRVRVEDRCAPAFVSDAPKGPHLMSWMAFAPVAEARAQFDPFQMK